MSANKTILIVEDEPAIAKALHTKLSERGFKIIEARNGKEGLTAAFANHPDLIVLDLMMPVMDGIAMLSELRADNWGKDAKVIVLTNLADSEKIAAVTEKRAIEYMIKTDWKIEDIINKIAGQLS